MEVMCRVSRLMYKWEVDRGNFGLKNCGTWEIWVIKIWEVDPPPPPTPLMSDLSLT